MPLNKNETREILLAEPCGMCGGVRRALAITAAELPVNPYVYHEIVHNKFIVEKLKGQNVTFVNSVDDVPDGATLIFSAHGVARAVEEQAAARHLRVIDATCPLVKKLHQAIIQSVASGARTILLGHAQHPETEGALGQTPPGTVTLIENAADIAALAPSDGREVHLHTQTTMDTELVETINAALHAKFKHFRPAPGVCYATAERQNAVRQLAKQCDLMLIIGSQRSSNSNRLREVAAAHCRAILLDRISELPPDALDGVKRVGVSAGASAPDELIAEAVEFLQSGTGESEKTFCGN